MGSEHSRLEHKSDATVRVLEERDARHTEQLNKLEARHREQIDKWDARHMEQLDKLEARHREQLDKWDARHTEQLDKLNGHAVKHTEQLDKLIGQVAKHTEQLDKLDDKVNKAYVKFEKQCETVDVKFDKVDAKFDKVDAKFDKVDANTNTPDKYEDAGIFAGGAVFVATVGPFAMNAWQRSLAALKVTEATCKVAEAIDKVAVGGYLRRYISYYLLLLVRCCCWHADNLQFYDMFADQPGPCNLSHVSKFGRVTLAEALRMFLSFRVYVQDDLPRGHLASFGLPQELAEKLMYQLSGGQKNRAAFAKMTWIKPHILPLDEYSARVAQAQAQAQAQHTRIRGLGPETTGQISELMQPGQQVLFNSAGNKYQHQQTVHQAAEQGTRLNSINRLVHDIITWAAGSACVAGESKWRPLELCRWPHRARLPAKGREYPALGCKKLRDRASKALAQQPVAQYCVPRNAEAVAAAGSVQLGRRMMK
ncbi:hypothetical protein QJQ45_014491 [Haematococcus lacustris]|nr:hypothetical protein QJQ45_014491 [Haematococcus lacustris]